MDLQCLSFVAERAGVSYSTLITWVENPDRAGAIPFNVADELLCATDQWTLWHGELSEWYYAVDLNWRTCACDGCDMYFYADPKKHGKKPLYCSKACANAASNMRTGESVRRVKNYGSRLAPRKGPKCRNGHDRTPENQILLGSGKIRCRQCNREASARAYEIKRKRERAQVAA